jgi:hypothetical protein
VLCRRRLQRRDPATGDDRATHDRATHDRAIDDRAIDDRAADDRAIDDRAADDRAADASSTTAPIDPIDELVATIERDLNLGEAMLFEIGADPAAPDARSKAERFFVGRSLENVLAGTEGLVADDLILLPSPTTPNVIRLMTDPVLDESGEFTRATAVTCRIDASEVWARVNDGDVRVPIATGSIRIDSESRFVFVDGIWKLDGGQVIRRVEDATDCDSAG